MARKRSRSSRRKRGMNYTAIVAVVVLAAVVALIALALTQCKPNVSATTQNIAIVVGNTQNSPETDISVADIDIVSLDPNNPIVTIINATATPTVTTIKINIDNLEAGRNALLRELKKITPQGDGANYVEAIKTAREKFNGQPGTIYVFGSGLSDNGLFNFAEDDLLSLSDDELRSLAAENATDLSNVTIRWYGAGNTTLPQLPLDSDLRGKVAGFYQTWAQASGADVSFTAITSKDYSVETNGTNVKPTPLPAGAKLEQSIVFDGREYPFVRDQDIFQDEGKAREILMWVASVMNNNSQSVIITGFVGKISVDDFRTDDPLAQARAETVRRILIEYGVDESRITTQNRGIGDATEVLQVADQRVELEFN